MTVRERESGRVGEREGVTESERVVRVGECDHGRV